MNIQNNSPKTNETAENALYQVQLKEALALTRVLQRTNADLMKQNAGLIQMNSRLINKFGDNKPQDQDNTFVNHVLSIITDNTILQDENTQTSADNTNLEIDNPHSITDKTKLHIDNNQAGNDNNHLPDDNTHSRTDNTSNQVENNTSGNENNRKPDDNTQSIIDNPKEATDNDIVYIDINGKRTDREKLLNMLRYRINLLMQRNFTDEELISIYADNFKMGKEKEIEQKKLKHEEKLKKVPALFQLENDNIPGKINKGNEFSDLVMRYKLLKKRGKQ